MAERITDKVARAAAAPETGNAITWDAELKGFGLRVTAAGARAFILNYRVAGRERRLTIGAYPDWSVAAARDEAKRLKREIDAGRDPLSRREADRGGPTVKDLTDRYIERHLPKKRASSQTNDRLLISKCILPDLGSTKVAEVQHADVDDLHRKLSKATPTQANRALALLSKMFSLAIAWKMRVDNPCKGVERNPEQRRNRYLTGDELQRLSAALASHANRSSANAVRLLLLTGARRGEVLGATWDQFDLDAGVWTKPSSHTKQKKEHRVPLSAPALQLLVEMKTKQDELDDETDRVEPHLFPGRAGTPAQATLKKFWLSICKACGLAVQRAPKRRRKAALVWAPTVRLHDLRHTYASILASAGLSLPVIGALLGHTQAGTTHRYAHLLDDPLRAATERVGAVVAAAAAAKPAGKAGVVKLRRGS